MATISELEYEPIDPAPCWFDPGGGVVAAVAIARNHRGMIRLEWGDRSSDVPSQRVRWTAPKKATGRPGKWRSPTTSIRVPEHAVERLLSLARELDEHRVPGVGANGVKTGDRPCGSSLLPEELEQMARLQFAGLTQYLEPEAFLRLAIAHVDQLKRSVQNSPRLVLITVDEASYLIESDEAAMAAAAPAIERLEAAITAAGLTARDDKLMLLAKLVKAMEQQGTLERMQEKA